MNFNQRRLFVISVSLLAYLLVFFQRTALTVIQPDLEAAFHLSGKQFSNLSGVYMYVYALLQIPVGLLVDFIGPRKTTYIGLFIASIGAGLMTFAPNYAWLFVGRFLSCVGIAPIFLNTLKLSAEWFKPSEFASLAGITLFVGNFGALLSSYPLSWLVQLTNWQTSFRIIAIFTFVIALLSLFFIVDKPSGCGFEDHFQSKPLTWKDTWFGLGLTLSKPVIYLPMAIYSFSLASVLTLQAAWGARMIQTFLSNSKTSAGFVVMFISIGIMTGALISGKLGDKFKKEVILISFLVPAALLWLSFLGIRYLSSIWIYTLWMLILGFASAGFSLTFSLGKEISGHRYSGIGMAVVNGSGFIFTAFILYLYGYILDSTKISDLFTVRGFMLGNSLLIISSVLAAILSLVVFYYKKNEKKPSSIH